MAKSVVEIVIKAVNQAKKGLTEPITDLDSLGKAAAKVGPAFVAASTAAVGALAYMVKGAIDTADGFNKMSQKTGIAVETLSTLAHAAALSDVPIGALQKGLVKMSSAMTDAAEGNAKASAKFDILGVAVKNADGTMRGADQVLGDVAERFKSMPDGALKTAAAVDLFGKAGADMIPMLNQGRDGLASMQAEARALGLEISGKTAAAAESFNDSITKLEGGTKGLINQFMAGLVPGLSQAADGLVKSRVEAGNSTSTLEYMGQIVGRLGLQFLALVETVKFAFTSIGTGFGALGAAVAAAFKGDFAEAGAALKAWKEDASSGASKVGDAWAAAFKPTIAAVETTKRATKDLEVENVAGAKKVEAANKAAAEAAKRLIQEIRDENAKSTLSKEEQIIREHDARIAAIESAAMAETQKQELIRMEFEATDAKLRAIWEADDQESVRRTEMRMQMDRDVAALEASLYLEKMSAGQQETATLQTHHLERLTRIDELQRKGMDANTAEQLRMAEGENLETQIQAKRIDRIKKIIDANGVMTTALTDGMMVFNDKTIKGTDKAGRAFETMWLSFREGLKRSAAQAAANLIVTKAAALLAAAFWAPAATASSIATLGAADITGVSAYTGALASGVAATTGLAAIAHGGLTNTPAEATYMLDKGERVVSPRQNKDLTQFLENGGGSQRIVINLDGRPILDHVSKATKSGELVIDARGVR